MQTKHVKIKELLERGVDKVIVKSELEKLLRSGRKLRVYLGIDPTATTLHLGNAIPLRKLRDFMELGHEVIFLVGSFTALIGDTSDKDSMRPALSREQIEANFADYKKQASKILDFKKAKIKYNGDWLSKLKFEDIVRLAQNFTVQQMLERDMYQERLKKDKPIGLHEFLYPLMQGYDSVVMDVDVELGGSDQLFNMLAGRQLQKIYNHKDKHVLTTQLLEGTDGRKMSKSYGNAINIMDSANEMFGKIMSIRDELISRYFVLCTDLALVEIAEIEAALAKGVNPRNAKARLAGQLVKQYHSAGESEKAEKEFDRVFKLKERPDGIRIVFSDSLRPVLVNTRSTSRVLVATGLSSSISEARRLIEQGGVRKNGKKIGEDFGKPPEDGDVLQVGKRNFVQIKKSSTR